MSHISEVGYNLIILPQTFVLTRHYYLNICTLNSSVCLIYVENGILNVYAI
jgi:hypothetical protein